MQADIHPKNYHDVAVRCSCGAEYPMRLAVDKDELLLEICANCHPFYTNTQKVVDTTGRVDRFHQKYGARRKKSSE